MEREWKINIYSQQYLGEKESIKFSDILDQFIETKEGTPHHPTLLSHKRILTRLFPVNKKLHDINNSDITNFKNNELNRA